MVITSPDARPSPASTTVIDPPAPPIVVCPPPITTVNLTAALRTTGEPLLVIANVPAAVPTV
jgi:hypothetical protein